MGYAFVRTGVFRNGAAQMAGLPLAKEIADLLIKRHHVDTRVTVPAWSGCPSRVSWLMPSETLNGFYERLGAVQADENYTGIVKRLSEHIDGTLSHDQIWREVPTAGSGKRSEGGRFITVRSLAFKNLAAMAAGLKALTDICDYVLKAYDRPTRLYVPVMGGRVTRAIMVRSGDDLDAAQALMDKVMNDDKFRPLLQRLTEYVDAPQTQDALWRVV